MLFDGMGSTKNHNKALRLKELQKLRETRSKGRRNEVIVGARLLDMLNKGEVSADEFRFVMGQADSPHAEPTKEGTSS